MQKKTPQLMTFSFRRNADTIIYFTNVCCSENRAPAVLLVLNVKETVKPISNLIQPGIETESTASVVEVLST